MKQNYYKIAPSLYWKDLQPGDVLFMNGPSSKNIIFTSKNILILAILKELDAQIALDRFTIRFITSLKDHHVAETYLRYGDNVYEFGWKYLLRCTNS